MMEKQPTSASTGINRGGLLLLVLCTATFSLILATSVFGSEESVIAAQRALTFAERLSYQRAIEEVYWRHRIWPKESPDPKPSLDAVMSQAQIEQKVSDYLRKSQALEDYWQRPLTAEQLQAEIDRMGKHTKQPDVLRELFAALDNDPFVIAECLARPALADRLLDNWYAYDEGIHGELKRRAEAELLLHPAVGQLKQINATYTETELIRIDRDRAESNRSAANAITLTSREWDKTVKTLAAELEGGNSAAAGLSAVQSTRLRTDVGTSGDTFSGARNTPIAHLNTGILSPLQEDETRYFATAVLAKSDDHLKLATVSWPKEQLQSWLARAEPQVPTATSASTFTYTLPSMSDAMDTCTDQTWRASALNLPDARDSHTAVWTGSEMIIWGGGFGYPFTPFRTGARYSPSTGTWINVSIVNAPSARGGHSAVWTGTQMIIWGGGWTNTGGRYNPSTDSWIATSTTNAPTGRTGHSAVWTGTQMIVWAGYGRVGYFNTGGRYNPTTNSWTAISTTNAPSPRVYQTAVWTGTRMIVWGGESAPNSYLNTGGRYNPSTNSWMPASTTNAPVARELHAAVWTGTQMIIWGGSASNDFNLNTGAKYNPVTDTWVTTNTTGAPAGRYYHTAVWTGSQMIIWGGQASSGFVNTGAKYNPGTNTWAAISTTNAPASRFLHTAVWTGTEMIVWGGDGNYSDTGALNTGGRYNPASNTWGHDNPPIPRTFHTAVWTGTEMIVWGGLFANISLNTGNRYYPSTDSWITTSLVYPPAGRYYHTTVWTGTQMIVWGGFSAQSVNTGGKYNPAANNWTATSIINAPSDRSHHSVVWTGTEMIVWGGYDSSGNLSKTGARYNSNTNSWTSTSTINAPSARSGHTAVWTGTEMIIWGGSPDVPIHYNGLNTGGRYNPTTNSWTTTDTTNPPDGRYDHTAVWTGSRMIIWGGEDSSGNLLNTGNRYDPITNGWAATRISGAPSDRTLHTAVWTGGEMIVWGGYGDIYYWLNTGGRYNPSTDSWRATSTANNVPAGRYRHTVVWSGNEMIVWGGLTHYGDSDSGGMYCAQSR